MNQSAKIILDQPHPFFVDFSKASDEAIDSILTALNREIDEAVLEGRRPSLEGAYGRLCPSTKTMM